MGLPAHGFNTLRAWEALDPWEQRIYLGFFQCSKDGSFVAGDKKPAQTKPQSAADALALWDKWAKSKKEAPK